MNDKVEKVENGSPKDFSAIKGKGHEGHGPAGKDYGDKPAICKINHKKDEQLVMADELDKKPKPIGTPAPNVPKPKQESVSNSAPKIDRQKSASLGKVKVQPGSPFKPESVPVGVQQTKHESSKHLDKRVNKMFKDTNQPTLGIWNKNNTNPMAKPDKVRFNPNLNYKPSKEALEAANRKKIMQQGFAPKNWDGKSDAVEPSLEQQFSDMKEFAKKQDEGLAKNLEQNPIPVPSKKKFDITARDEFLETIEADNEDEANKIAYDKYHEKYPLDDDLLRADEQMPESEQRAKASELYGTDLNKQSKNSEEYYNSISQELDKGDMINLDAGLLPYEYGFETNGYEDLAVDAYKNPETGKYEVYMYPETENGPKSGYYPDETGPAYEFDSFEDLKAFIENGYKEVEKPQWDPDNNPGSAVVTKELEDYARNYLTKQGYDKTFVDSMVEDLHKNSNRAEWFKAKMKAEWDKNNGGNK